MAERKANRDRAAGHLERAGALCADLGAIYLRSDIEVLRRSSGLRLRNAPVLGAPPPGAGTNRHPELTSREMEVLRLVVAGHSNGQIALRLGISVKTASAHVSNILRKLDAENRVEAAVRASRIGLVEGFSRQA